MIEARQVSISTTYPLAEGAEMSPYMTTQEVAEELRTPIETVRYWRHAGRPGVVSDRPPRPL
jgi:hypothetical protein